MERELSFNIAINGVSTEAEELAKLEYQLKNLRTEKTELLKVAQKEGFLSNENKAKLAAYNREITEQDKALKLLKRTVDTANDSLARKKALLIELTRQSDAAGGSIAQKMAPAIKKLSDEIKAGENARGVFSRNVGNYPTIMTQASAAAQEFGTKITTSMQNLLSAGTIMAVVAVGLKKLKEAFMSTVQGMDFMNQIAQVSKQVFYDLATSMSFNVSKMMEANEIAKEMNAIRQGDLIDLMKIRDMENDIKDLRLKSVDATLSLADKQMYLNQALQKEDELIKYKTADIKEDLKVIERSMKLRPDDYNLQLLFAQKIAELRDIQSEKNLRIASAESATREKQQKEEEQKAKNWEAYIAEIDEAVKKTDLLNAENEELYLKIRMLAEKDFMAYTAPGGGDIPAEIANEQFIQAEKDRLWEEGMRKARENFAANKALAQEQANEIVNIELAKLDQKQEIADAEISIAFGISDTLKNLGGKNKAIAYAAMAIEKAAAIAQIISNIATANAKAIATSPLTFGQPWVGLNTGIGAISIAAVIAESVKSAGDISKYEGGGRTNRGLPINTGTSDNLLIAVQKDREAIINERQIARLGGSGALRRAGVPGFASGGVAGSMPYINPSSPASSQDIQSMSDRMSRIEIVLDVNKVNDAQREVSLINEGQSI